MYLFKYSIQNTYSKYFQQTFNMLLKATMLKPACIYHVQLCLCSEQNTA